jgi:hypothetical protein
MRYGSARIRAAYGSGCWSTSVSPNPGCGWPARGPPRQAKSSSLALLEHEAGGSRRASEESFGVWQPSGRRQDLLAWLASHPLATGADGPGSRLAPVAGAAAGQPAVDGGATDAEATHHEARCTRAPSATPPRPAGLGPAGDKPGHVGRLPRHDVRRFVLARDSSSPAMPSPVGTVTRNGRPHQSPGGSLPPAASLGSQWHEVPRRHWNARR